MEAMAAATAETPECLLFAPFAQNSSQEREIWAEILPDQDIGDGSVWKIANKYYTASVRLGIVRSKEELATDVCPQAAVAFFPQFGAASLDSLFDSQDCAASQVFLDSCQSRLLVVGSFSAEAVKDEAELRCLERVNSPSGIEIVDFSEDDADEQGEKSSPESDQSSTREPFLQTSRQRVAEALQAVMWPNMVRKSNVPRLRDNEGGKSNVPEGPVTGAAVKEESNEADMENFEALFSRLAEFKSQAHDLAKSDNDEERRLHAEKVVRAFWCTLGEDLAELEGGRDSSEEEIG